MKKKLSILLALFSIYTFSQNIYVTKRDYSGSPTIHSLQKLDETNGNLQNNYNYTSTFLNNYGSTPKKLTFNPQTSEIFGLVGNTIVKYNTNTGIETSFDLPIVQYVDYRDLIVANNRLFVTKRDYTNSSNYIHSLQELNQTDGNVINNYNYTTLFPSSYSPESLTFNILTKEIIGISGNIVSKYNIETGVESSFLMPALQSVDYGDLIVANNRLFITKRDYSNSPTYIHSLQEINQTNGTLINNYNYTTSFPNSYSPKSLTFDNTTKEIYGITNNIVTKYNINTGIESTYNLPIATSNDYGAIVSTNTEQNLSITEFNQNSELKISKAFNLLGQEIPIETYNEIIIVKFENGESRKIINLKK